MPDSSPAPKRFLSELKRRRVTRVAGVYVVAALGAIYAADAILPRLLLPEWTVTFVIVLAGLGLPIVLVLTWVFDRTPEGLRRTADLDRIADDPNTAAATVDGDTLAVLPFANLSPIR